MIGFGLVGEKTKIKYDFDEKHSKFIHELFAISNFISSKIQVKSNVIDLEFDPTVFILNEEV